MGGREHQKIDRGIVQTAEIIGHIEGVGGRTGILGRGINTRTIGAVSVDARIVGPLVIDQIGLEGLEIWVEVIGKRDSPRKNKAVIYAPEVGHADGPFTIERATQ